jgi:hypothetical protein
MVTEYFLSPLFDTPQIGSENGFAGNGGDSVKFNSDTFSGIKNFPSGSDDLLKHPAISS